jgi:hypothetical protein
VSSAPPAVARSEEVQRSEEWRLASNRPGESPEQGSKRQHPITALKRLACVSGAAYHALTQPRNRVVTS